MLLLFQDMLFLWDFKKIQLQLIILRTVPLTHAPEINIGVVIPVIPAVIILAISIWILSINIKYSKKIKEGNTTEEYKTFNSITFVLLLIQLVLLYKNNIPYSFSIMSLLASFQMIIVFIMQMNLEYFITDG